MKKKILLVDGIYPPNTRNVRIYKTIEKSYEIKFCLWDRKKISFEQENKKDYIFTSNEGYGNKIKKMLGMFKYFTYLKKVNREYKPNILIASQWDMLILLYFIKNDKQKLIYDNIDMPSSHIKILLNILKSLEKKCLKKVDGIIHASRFFKDNYSFFTKNQLILENKPLKKLYKFETLNYKSKKIKISFIGTLRYYDVLEKLVNSVRIYEDKIELLFFGGGPSEEKLKKLVKKNNQKNIIFFGKYDYEEIGKFYNLSDLIWAVYPSEDYNVKYAISNKFHESLVFEKPCLFSRDTLLGEYVMRNNIGITVKMDTLDEFIAKLYRNEINLDKIKDKIKDYKNKNPNVFWEFDEEKILEFLKNI